MRYFVTGDIHGDFRDLLSRIRKNHIKAGDCLIILGDACFNFFRDIEDIALKSSANNLGITLFCIQGNHEIRPKNIKTYKTKEWNGGIVWYEPEFPNLLFAKDGEIYNINGNKTLVIGGAYSVDKYYRAAKYYMRSGTRMPYLNTLIKIAEGNTVSLEDKKIVDEFLYCASGNFGWWNDEQISDEDKEKIDGILTAENRFDIVLSHTCPLKYEPTEVFLTGVNQDMVDKTMETWLNEVEERIEYKKWYAGHYHLNKNLGNGFEFLFGDVKEIVLKGSESLEQNS